MDKHALQERARLRMQVMKRYNNTRLQDPTFAASVNEDGSMNTGLDSSIGLDVALTEKQSVAAQSLPDRLRKFITNPEVVDRVLSHPDLNNPSERSLLVTSWDTKVAPTLQRIRDKRQTTSVLDLQLLLVSILKQLQGTVIQTQAPTPPQVPQLQPTLQTPNATQFNTPMVTNQTTPQATPQATPPTTEAFSKELHKEAANMADPRMLQCDIKREFNKLRSFCIKNIRDNYSVQREYNYSAQMEEYWQKYTDKNAVESLAVEKGGRLYSGGSIQGMLTAYRGLLLAGITTDIDMGNAHPTILLYLCRQHNITCPYLTQYVSRRADILAMFPSKAAGKRAILKSTNSAFLVSPSENVPEFLRAYDREVKTIQAAISSLPEYAIIRDSVPQEKRRNWNGCTMNRVLCKNENMVLQHMIDFIKSRNIELAVSMFDGLMVYGELYNNIQLLIDMEQYVETKMPGLNMKFSYKAHDTSIVIPAKFDVDAIEAKLKAQIAYWDWRENFNKTHCMIVNTSLFIKMYFKNDKFDRFVTFTSSKLCVSYGDAGKIGKYSFIEAWMKDKEKRSYEEAVVCPPPLKCTEKEFNLWRPFPHEEHEVSTTDLDYDLDAVEQFRIHLGHLCDNDPAIVEWMECWIAHSLQMPAEKPGVMPTFISNQGAGKNIFIDELRKFYGDGRTLESASPEENVWGRFNGQMMGAYFVILTEFEGRSMRGNLGKIKTLLTDKKMEIQFKGKDTFLIDAYHRFIAISNMKDCTITSEDDRRNLIIRSSDWTIKNWPYLDPLIAALQRPHANRSIFWFYKRKDIANWNHREPPRTEHHKLIIEASRNPVDKFLQDWAAMMPHDTPTKEISAKELLSSFQSWCKGEGCRLGENLNTSQLMLKILTEVNKTFVISKRHTSAGNVSTFDVAAMRKFYGISNECYVP